MHYDPEKHHRRSIRLDRYDYRQAGAYFVTVCTKDRECLFGEIVGGATRLNEFGRSVQDEWFRTSAVRPGIELDAFVVMPNHIHGVLCFVAAEGTARRAPTKDGFRRPAGDSLATVVRAFKSAATARINKMRGTPALPVWQRNFYEHVIRSEDELHRIRIYIDENPLKWDMDQENPTATMTDNVEPWE